MRVVPTLYYSGGNFYALSDGKIHLLGAKIISNDIYLLGQKGVKIEAAPYQQNKLVSFTESGTRIGYNAGHGQVSISSELFKNINKQEYNAQLYEASEIIAKNKLLIASKDGKIEALSSSLKFTKAEITAKELHFGTYKEQHNKQRTTTTMQAGIHIGMQEDLSGTAKLANHLIHKNGTHWLDILDRALNLYQLGTQVQQVAGDIKKLVGSTTPAELKQNLQNLDSVRFGVWVSGKVTSTTTESQQHITVDNMIMGGDIDIRVDGEAVIEGIICHVDNFKLKAASLKATASHDTIAHETTSGEIELIIPISGNVRGGLGVNTAEASSSITSYHDNNMIMVKGQLEIDLEGDGRVSGIRMQASSVKVRAQNLIVESLQDIVQERMSSMQMHIGFNKAGTYKELGGKAEVGKRDAAWTKAIGSIIGTQVTHVVVQQTLEIAGGLIANAEVNADGTLTDKGRLYVEAGSIIARQLHDYDNGKSFGLGTTLTKKADSSGKLAWGVGVPVVCSFNEQSRDILPVIGSGEIKLTGLNGSVPSELSRNVNSQIGITTGDKASLRATVPVSDMVEFINSQLQPKPIIPEVAKDIDKEELAEEVLTETQQVEAEQEKEAQQQKEQKAREVKQAKQNQQQEQAQQQKEQEELEALELSFKNYEEYSRTNHLTNPQEGQAVEPNAESFHYTDLFLQAKEQADETIEEWQPKEFRDIFKNLYRDFVDLKTVNPYFYLNVPAAILAGFGETSEYVGENVVYLVNKVPGGKYVLEALGTIVGGGIQMIHNTVERGAKLILNEDQINFLIQEHNKLPHGIQVLGQDIADGAVLYSAGKVGKLAKKGLTATTVAESVELAGKIEGAVDKAALTVSEQALKYPATFEGEVINFATREEARLFGANKNEAIKNAANKFFKEASNANLEGTNILKNRNFKIVKMENSNIVMEFTSLSNKPGWSKRYIQIINNEGTILKEINEIIQPNGIVKETKTIH